MDNLENTDRYPMGISLDLRKSNPELKHDAIDQINKSFNRIALQGFEHTLNLYDVNDSNTAKALIARTMLVNKERFAAITHVCGYIDEIKPL